MLLLSVDETHDEGDVKIDLFSVTFREYSLSHPYIHPLSIRDLLTIFLSQSRQKRAFPLLKASTRNKSEIAFSCRLYPPPSILSDMKH